MKNSFICLIIICILLLTSLVFSASILDPNVGLTDLQKAGSGGYLLLIISISVIIFCVFLVVMFILIKKFLLPPKINSSPLQPNGTPFFVNSVPIASAPPKNILVPSRVVQKPTNETIESFIGLLGSSGVEEAKVLNQNASFVRSTLLLESKTKMSIIVMKAFRKGTRSVKILEKLPDSLNLNSSEIDSLIPFRLLQGHIIEFTMDPTQDISYYINRKITSQEFDLFTCPIISKITISEAEQA